MLMDRSCAKGRAVSCWELQGWMLLCCSCVLRSCEDKVWEEDYLRKYL